jgi:hypothetical protein
MLSDDKTMQLVTGVTDKSQDINKSNFDLYQPSFTLFDPFATHHLPPPTTTDGELVKQH